MAGEMNEGLTPTTAIGTLCSDAAPLSVAVQGQIYEAVDPQAWGPVAGDTVLVDYLPVSGQWVIVAVL